MVPEQREALDEIVTKMQAGRISRRTFLERTVALGLASSAAVSLLEACGGGGNGGSSTTNIVWESEHDDSGVYGELVDNYNKTNKDNVHVTFINGPADTGQLRTKFVTMLRGRSGSIDVMSMDIIWPAEFGANGWTAPIDDKWSASERSKYLPGPVEGCTYNGHVWAAPFRTDAGLMYYRTDLVTTPPNTWEDLTKMATDLQSSGKVKYGYVWQGAQYEGLVCDFVEVIYGYGGSVLDPNNPKTVTVSQAPVQQGLTQMVGWIGPCSPAAVTNYKEEDARTTWQNGDSAFMRNWPYAYSLGNDPSTSKIAGKFNVHPMLYGGSNTTGHSAIGGWNLGINAFSKNTDASWKFVQYMMGAYAQKQAALKASLTTTLLSVYDDSDVLAKNPFFKDLKPVFQTAQPRPVTPKYPDVTLAIQNRVHAALLKQSSVSDSLNALSSDLQGIVA